MKYLLTILGAVTILSIACSSSSGAPATTAPGGGTSTSGGGGSAVDQGKALFTAKGCIACHTAAGVPGATAKHGPNLSAIGDPAKRPQIADGKGQPCEGCAASAGLPNTPAGMKQWLTNPPGVKPGTAMPNLSLSDSEKDSLIAFLATLKG